MGKNNECQNVQVCQFGLPGFSKSSTTEVEDMNSYDFDTTFTEPDQYTGTLVRKQKILFLTVEINIPTSVTQYNFTFNGLTELIGATNVKVGLINSNLFTLIGANVVGSTLNFSALLSSLIPQPITLNVFFSVSYTPAA